MDSDAALLDRYKTTRDAEAFAVLANRYARIVYGAALRITGNRHDAEEVSQECFLALARQAGAIRSSVPGWLHILAVSRAKDFVRGRQRRQKLETAPEAQHMNDATESTWAALAPQVDDAIAELPEELRGVIVLHFLQGKPQAEIAAQEGVNQSTVSRRIEKAVDALRDGLRKRGVIVTSTLLATLLAARGAEAAPATLVAALGKMAASGVGQTLGLGAMVVTPKAVAIAAAVLVLLAGAAALVWGGHSRSSGNAPSSIAGSPSPVATPQIPVSPATEPANSAASPRPMGELANSAAVAAAAPGRPAGIAPPAAPVRPEPTRSAPARPTAAATGIALPSQETSQPAAAGEDISKEDLEKLVRAAWADGPRTLEVTANVVAYPKVIPRAALEGDVRALYAESHPDWTPERLEREVADEMARIMLKQQARKEWREHATMYEESWQSRTSGFRWSRTQLQPPPDQWEAGEKTYITIVEGGRPVRGYLIDPAFKTMSISRGQGSGWVPPKYRELGALPRWGFIGLLGTRAPDGTIQNRKMVPSPEKMEACRLGKLAQERLICTHGLEHDGRPAVAVEIRHKNESGGMFLRCELDADDFNRCYLVEMFNADGTCFESKEADHFLPVDGGTQFYPRHAKVQEFDARGGVVESHEYVIEKVVANQEIPADVFDPKAPEGYTLYDSAAAQPAPAQE